VSRRQVAGEPQASATRHPPPVSNRERAADRGSRRATEIRATLGREAREARWDRGVTLASVARAVGLSAAEVSRIERGLVPGVALADLSRILAVVGLELVARTYPGGQPLRDRAHVALVARFRGLLGPRLRWRSEVPLPMALDQRAWDGVVFGTGWSYGVEAETAPRDVQSLLRRLHLKARDGGVDGVLLVMPDTRRARLFARTTADLLAADFPVVGRAAIERLGRGDDPGGNAVVFV